MTSGKADTFILCSYVQIHNQALLITTLDLAPSHSLHIPLLKA